MKTHGMRDHSASKISGRRSGNGDFSLLAGLSGEFWGYGVIGGPGACGGRVVQWQLSVDGPNLGLTVNIWYGKPVDGD